MNFLLTISQASFEWVWKTSICAAFLAGLVLLMQSLLGKRLRPRLHYALSLLVLIRLLAPAIPTSSFSLEKFIPRRATIMRPIGMVSYSTEEARSASLTLEPAGILLTGARVIGPQTTTTLPCVIWLFGASMLAGLAAWRYRQWSLRLNSAEIILDARLLALLEEAKREMGVRCHITALTVSCATGPAVFGILDVRLILPDDFLRRLNEQELRLVLLHEMAHVRRHDALFNTFLMAVQFLHWFNPLVWLALHRIRADRETICDEMVMQKTEAVQRASYGLLLLRLIEQFPTGQRFMPTNAAMVGSQNEIKRRIIMIKNYGQKHFLAGAIATIAIGVLGCAAFTRAQTPASASSTPSAVSSSALATQLIGTWVLEKELGPESNPSGVGTRMKSFTGTHWEITQPDPKTGVIVFHHGGTYKLEGNKYFEHKEFAGESTKHGIGNTGEFALKIEGDTLTQTGLNNPWNEIWKRVK